MSLNAGSEARRAAFIAGAEPGLMIRRWDANWRRPRPPGDKKGGRAITRRPSIWETIHAARGGGTPGSGEKPELTATKEGHEKSVTGGLRGASGRR